MFKRLLSITEVDGRRFEVDIQQQDKDFTATATGTIGGEVVLSRTFTSKQEDALVQVADFIDDAGAEFETFPLDEEIPHTLS